MRIFLLCLWWFRSVMTLGYFGKTINCILAFIAVFVLQFYWLILVCYFSKWVDHSLLRSVVSMRYSSTISRAYRKPCFKSIPLHMYVFLIITCCNITLYGFMIKAAFSDPGHCEWLCRDDCHPSDGAASRRHWHQDPHAGRTRGIPCKHAFNVA